MKEYVCKWLKLHENVILSLDSFMRVHCCCVLPQAGVNIVVSLLSHLSISYTLICTPCFFFSLSLQLSVDTLQFLLFLYIQQLNRVSLRTSLIGEEWPSHRTRSPSPSDREAKTSSQNKVLVACFAMFCNSILLPIAQCKTCRLSS